MIRSAMPALRSAFDGTGTPNDDRPWYVSVPPNIESRVNDAANRAFPFVAAHRSGARSARTSDTESVVSTTVPTRLSAISQLGTPPAVVSDTETARFPSGAVSPAGRISESAYVSVPARSRLPFGRSKDGSVSAGAGTAGAAAGT